MARPSLLFVVPAWGRLQVTRTCFLQHAWMLAGLRDQGIDAHELVIASDENLEAAAHAGLLTLEHPNRLGQRWNVGYEYAAIHGFDYVAPLGSDNWLDPPDELPPPATILCTRSFTQIDPRGGRQLRLRIGYEGGCGIRVMPIELLAGCDYAPLDAGRKRSCDYATLKRICNTYGDVAFAYRDRHPYDVVGFQSAGQITPIRLLEQRWLVEERKGDPFAGLDDHYPAQLVRSMRESYALEVAA